ncbi:MAG: 8-amino-7-oxononanoate synthase [Rickettsiales bacterium]|nr:8-amino-7-oxononanoate synthase [Rickettsiales bacterium]
MNNSYSQALQKIKEKNLYRQLASVDIIGVNKVYKNQKNLISFCSNDYFNLSQNAAVKKAAIAAIEKFGVGATSSRYIIGNNSLYKKLEKQIARLKNCDDAVVFSSGYAAAIGTVPALVNAGDLIIADRLSHSCLLDAAKLSDARLMRFLHNDFIHAKKILTENRHKFKKCLIITETVFSMDGDVGEVSELLKLADEFNCLLIADTAHDLFLSEDFGAKNRPNYLQMGTLSKAVGALGGYIAGEKNLIDYLRNFAKSQIYSTALPPAILAASLASLKIIEKKNLGKKALQNARYFCQLLNLPETKSAIVPIILGDNKKVLQIAKNLEMQGFLISAIRPPTVENNKARLRITFSSAHKKIQIKKLVKFLANVK